MTFGTFFDGVEHDWHICVCHPDGLDWNVNFKKGRDDNDERLETYKARFVKSVCRIDVSGVGGWHGYDVELLPEGAPEQDVVFEKYERQVAIPW